MSSRDITFLGTGAFVFVSGSIATLAWSTLAGIIALLVMSFIILILLVLIRNQLARVQQRTLTLLRDRPKLFPATPQANSSEALQISTKKIIGLLEAQQISMDLLSAKVDKER